MKSSRKSSQSYTLLDIFRITQAITLGYIWGYFDLPTIIDSIAMTPLLFFVPHILPLLYMAQITLPVFIAFGIYQYLDVTLYQKDLFKDTWISIASLYTALRTLNNAIGLFLTHKLHQVSSFNPMKIFYFFSISALSSAYHKIFATGSLKTEKRFTMNLTLKAILYSFIEVSFTLPPLYALLKTFTPKRVFSIIQYPIMALLSIGAFITQVKKDPDPVSLPSPATTSKPESITPIDTIKATFTLLAHIAAVAQTVVLSHILTSMFFSSPLTIHLAQTSLLILSLMPTSLLTPIFMASSLIAPAVIPATRAFIAYCLATDETDIIYDGASKLHTKASEIIQDTHEYVTELTQSSSPEKESMIGYLSSRLGF